MSTGSGIAKAAGPLRPLPVPGVALALVLLLPVPAFAAMLGGTLPGGALVRSPVRSWKALKFRHVVKQKTDFSCGAASVATILRYAYGRKVTAHQVLRGMLSVSNPGKVRRKGFSMYDIQQYVQKRLGMRGEGYRIGLDKLLRVRIPVIVLLDLSGYRHFVVLRHADRKRVWLADPALGDRRVGTRRFMHQWNGIIFAIVGPGYRRKNPLVAVSPPLGKGRMLSGNLPRPDTLVEGRILRFSGARPSQSL